MMRILYTDFDVLFLKTFWNKNIKFILSLLTTKKLFILLLGFKTDVKSFHLKLTHFEIILLICSA